MGSFISLRDGIGLYGSLGEQELYHLALSLASCLNDLHSKGEFHGFLSPDFVALSKDGAVKLGASSEDATNSVLPEYIAPEVLTGTRVSPLSDVYQLGLLLQESIACCKPFSFEDPEMKVSSIYKIKPFLEPPSVNKGFADIIKKCYDKESSKRFTDAGVLLKALEKLSDDEKPFCDYKTDEVNFHLWFSRSLTTPAKKNEYAVTVENDEQAGSTLPLGIKMLMRTLFIGVITCIVVYGLSIFFNKFGGSNTINDLRISFVGDRVSLEWNSPEEFRRFNWNLYLEDSLMKSGVSEGSSFSTYSIHLSNLKIGNFYKISLYTGKSEVGRLAFTYTGEVK